MISTKIENIAKKLEDFVSSSTNIAVFFDDDVDGIISQSLFETYLNSLNKKIKLKLFFDSKIPPFSEEFNERIKENNIDLLVFLDFSVGGFGYFEEYKDFVNLNNEIKVITIDHHKNLTNYEVSDNTLEINSSKLQDEILGEQYCTTKLVYDLVEELNRGLLSDKKWLCAIGIIGDYCQGTWSEFILDIINDNNKKFIDEDEIIIPKNNEDYYLTPFGKVSNLIFFGISKGSSEINVLLEDIINSKNIFDLKRRLEKYSSVKNEVYDYIENYDYFIKQYSPVKDQINVFEIEIKSNNRIETIVANLIASKDKNSIFFVYNETKDGFFHISARLQSRSIDLGKLFSQVSDLFDGANGGGHEAAAGALVRKEIFSEFKDAFYHKLKEVELNNINLNGDSIKVDIKEDPSKNKNSDFGESEENFSELKSKEKGVDL